MKWVKFCLLLIFLMSFAVYGQNSQDDFDQQIYKILTDHYNKYKDQEYFSGATLSVYIPQQKIKNYYLGTVSHNPKSELISANTLFEIGSITKSFTSALILQLEKAGNLHLNDLLEDWLPDYKKWPGIHIDQLLNMTSGIPNYSDTPLFNAQIYYNLSRSWTDDELIDYVYPLEFSPPLRTGFFYSNTNYILAALIIQKSTKNSFSRVLMKNLIRPADLQNTFYWQDSSGLHLSSRLAHGYNYNQYDNPRLVGKDLVESNLSWAAAAGGIISTSEDIIKWVQALYVDSKILDTQQKNQLMNLVSQTTGEPIRETSANDPRAFGLGVAQAYDPDLGRFWYYEGETLGFRAIYWYNSCNGIIISAIFNSATDASNDHIGELLKPIYQLIMAQNPQLICH